MTSKKEISIRLFMVVFSIMATDLLLGLFIIPHQHNAFRCAHYYYHHDLLPNRAYIADWGDSNYMVYTNSLGFRDSFVRKIPLVVSKERILFIGDSFTEGLGVPYGESFAGLVGSRLDSEVLNAGVVSYSPKLYYLKVRYLINKVHLKFDKLVVFIDIGDVMNEIEYEDFVPEKKNPDKILSFRLNKFMRDRSSLWYLIGNLFMRRQERERLEKLVGDTPCWGSKHDEIYDVRVEGAWTIDKNLFDKYGKKGLELARQNMQQLADLCRSKNIPMYIAVYPWPTQIYYYDRDSIQVRFWRDFSAKNKIGFIDFFPDFIDRERFADFDDVYGKYFIKGDVHWNKEGHRLIADKLTGILGKGVEQGSIPRSGTP